MKKEDFIVLKNIKQIGTIAQLLYKIDCNAPSVDCIKDCPLYVRSECVLYGVFDRIDELIREER